MPLGISLEVTVPLTIDRAELYQIGVEVVPNPHEGFTASDVVEWGFTSPQAIAAMYALGVRWNAVATGTPPQEADLTPAQSATR